MAANTPPTPIEGSSAFPEQANGTVAAATKLMTTRAATVVSYIVVYVEAVSGYVSPATISIGSNASTYNNIMTATSLVGLDTVGESYIYFLPSATVFASTAAASDIYVNVTVAATATTYTLRFAFDYQEF